MKKNLAQPIPPTILVNQPKVPKDYKIIDTFETSVKELAKIFSLHNPDANILKNKLSQIKPIWVRYGSKKIILKTLPEKYFFLLKTSRNKDIINDEQQQSYRDLKIGIAGLSVGSSIKNALVITGGPKNLSIADPDVLELSNLNRLQANLFDIGKNKVFIAAERAWESDPFLNIKTFTSGLNETNLEDFLLKPKISVFIDAMDNFYMKYLVRKFCRSHGIPIIMATDNGDGVILDIERYDLNSKKRIFNGLFEKYSNSQLKNLSKPEWMKLAIQILGKNNLSPSMNKSIKQISKTLPAVPQLGTTANMAASCVSYALRLISNGNRIKGRFIISLEKNIKLNV
jgi:tRNA A37 threonylcarbamoyladenosine dehydratase